MKFNEAWEMLMQGKTIESCETGFFYEAVFDEHDKEDIISVKADGKLIGFWNDLLSLIEITGEWNVLD